MAASSPNERRHRWFFMLSLLFVVLTLTTGYTLWRYLQFDTVETLKSEVQRLDGLMRAVRWFLIILTTASWPALISQCGAWRWLSKNKTDRFMQIRWRLVAWLVFIELMIGTPVLPWVFQNLSA